MIEQLVGQFLGSADGKNALSELVGHGLDQQQATSAVTATAQGLASQLGGDGGNPLAAIGGLLGGSGGGNPLAALGGLFSGNDAGGGAPLNALAAPIANFVSEKTGLAPQLAQTVVSVVLPKVLAYFQSSTQA